LVVYDCDISAAGCYHLLEKLCDSNLHTIDMIKEGTMHFTIQPNFSWHIDSNAYQFENEKRHNTSSLCINIESRGLELLSQRLSRLSQLKKLVLSVKDCHPEHHHIEKLFLALKECSLEYFSLAEVEVSPKSLVVLGDVLRQDKTLEYIDLKKTHIHLTRQKEYSYPSTYFPSEHNDPEVRHSLVHLGECLRENNTLKTLRLPTSCDAITIHRVLKNRELKIF